MYTEAEAKTRWCPLSRAIVWNDSETLLAAGANLKADGEPASMCIASACMAWRVSAPGQNLSEAKEYLAAGRFIEAIRAFRVATGLPLKEAKDALESIRSGDREWPSAEDKGFCGAFGNPKAAA